jgi:hypothetical protein
MLTLRKGSRMLSGRTLLLLGLGLFLCLTTLVATAAGLLRPAVNFPLPVDSYHDQQIPSLFGKLTGRIQREPLNLVATIVFLGAIVHTFLAARFRKIAHIYAGRKLDETKFSKLFEALNSTIVEVHKQLGAEPCTKKCSAKMLPALCFYISLSR